jgi:mono/diheme cytochrome c family protein
MNSRRAILAVVIVVGVFALHSLRHASQETFAADAPAPHYDPGLTLTFTPTNGKSQDPIDARTARLVALFVPSNSPASPALVPGPFIATWNGILATRLRDQTLFAATGNGDLQVTLNDAIILEIHGNFAGQQSQPIKLKKGKNLLMVKYTSPAQGDAAMRLLWADAGQPFDPIPPTVFTHIGGDALLLRSSELRSGRELVATMRCLNCHTSKDQSPSAMPELSQDAPDLTGVGERLRPQWIAYWITNPHALRPTAEMPRVFHDKPAAASPEVDPRAWDIAAYLTSGATPAATVGDADAATVAKGARLFTNLGCVACHVAPGIDDSTPALNRIPLKYIGAKFPPGALKAFLQKPESHFAWIKMPNFHFSDDEADALTGYLLAHAKEDALPAVKLPAGDPAKGKVLFALAGCINCHASESNQTPMHGATMDLSRANWAHGCMADDSSSINGVDFGFTNDQRVAIRAFAANDFSSLNRDSPAEFIERQRTSLHCIGCHSIDDRDNDWSNLDQEIGEIEQDLPADSQIELSGDQGRPALTWTGEKLRPDWTAAFLAGEISYKPRQWLFARMPSFPSRSKLLARAMAAEHGWPLDEPANPPADTHLAEIGQTLVGRGGFTCIQCHPAGSQAALAQEWPAPNLSHASARLRHDYYFNWMRHPNYYMPGTRMPQFGDATGKTTVKSVLDGDAAKQNEAIWQYLLEGEKIAPPP